jgi:hypothetical protein
MAIILGVPILGYVTSPLGIKPKQGEWIRLGKVTSVKIKFGRNI